MSDEREWNHVCTWQSGALGCTWPVARFDEGRRSGFCIFHRHTPDGYEAAQIAAASLGHTREGYLARAKALVYGNGTDTPSVAATRATLRVREPPEPGSNG